ncbi:hypothetical protein TRVL_01439 [Trypanosoma vivax]|uniref:Transmembrane protein n=1 Tax=Trypanosoma vivax (strain Y486) TaxID=1055687 RepID=G0U772_TRYVY|nr:hypothetical protein TRVL_01439 [Trypanosoma vivax]CCC51729.1 conserved hypothetical protein [Trypanosoma vivax Y486]
MSAEWAADTGECGSCSGSVFSSFAYYSTMLPYLASFVLFVLFFVLAQSTATANAFIGAAVLCFVIARTLRATMQFLWHQRGRFTFTRVTACTTPLLPVGLKSHSMVHMLLADAVLLPLCVAVTAFHDVSVFAQIGNVLYPRHITYVALLSIVPIVGTSLAVAHNVALIRSGRSQSELLDHKLPCTARAISSLSLWLGVPSLCVMSATLPCDGGNMRFWSNGTCLSHSHRAFVSWGFILLVLYSLVMDMVTGSLCGMECLGVSIPLYDSLMMQLVTFHRLGYIFVCAFANGPQWYMLTAAFSMCILTRACLTANSVAKVLHNMTKVPLLLCLLSSICCLSSHLTSHAVWIWISVMTTSWIVILVAFLLLNGASLYDKEEEVWNFEL